MPRPTPPAPRLLLAFLAVAAVCRMPITSVPPALAGIRADLGLSPTLAGATTSLPVACFGVFAFLTPLLVARTGAGRALLLALAVTTAGLVVRWWPATVPFYAGTLLVGVGIAVLNVVLPAVIRRGWPGEVPHRTAQYTVTMILGASLASAASALLAPRVGWVPALGVWALPTALALVLWATALRSVEDGAPAQAPSGLAQVARMPRAWWAAVFMGAQSLCFYVPLTWIPDILRSHGATPPVPGLAVAGYMALGILGSHLGPRMATGPRALVTLGGFFAVYALGVLALLGSLPTALAGVVVMGFGQGAGVAIALTFIAHTGRPHDVPAVSALAQGVGFLLAAVGPVTAGALYTATGGWAVPVLVLLAVNLVQAGSGLVLAYPERR